MSREKYIYEKIESCGAKSIGSLILYKTKDNKIILATGHGNALEDYPGSLIEEVVRRINSDPQNPSPQALKELKARIRVEAFDQVLDLVKKLPAVETIQQVALLRVEAARGEK